MTEDTGPWLRFYIRDTHSEGVDTRSLSRFLDDLSDALLTAARHKLGVPYRRAGRPSAEERRLAAVRVVAVKPGSVEVLFREPLPVESYQLDMPLHGQAKTTADDVVDAVISEIARTAEGAPVEPGLETTRVAVERLLGSARAIGRFAEVNHQPASGARVSASLDLAQPRQPAQADEQVLTVTLFGHVYMVDVEPGRQRLRVKLPTGADCTMDLVPELRGAAKQYLGQPVKVLVEEARVNRRVVRRLVKEVTTLDLSHEGPERPPHSLHELAAQQGLASGAIPDYTALASAVWPDVPDLDEWEMYAAGKKAPGL